MEPPQRNPLPLSTAMVLEDSEPKTSSKGTEFFKKLTPQISSCPEQDYLLGLRGVLVVQSFIWVFLLTFARASVKDSANIHGPAYQLILRRTLSVVFWNESLIYSWFIVLQARSISIPFLRNPSEVQVASSAFRRGLRLLIPTATALAIVKIVFNVAGENYISEYKTLSGNISFNVPYNLPGFMGYCNAVFNLFWVTRDFASQAGSYAFPSQTLWIVTVLYSKSYTVFMTMVMAPYTRNSWRVKALLFFILPAWWVQSWSWFSITGLLLADIVMKMEFKAISKQGVPVWKLSRRIPSWILYLLLSGMGLMMMFFWAAWKPGEENGEPRIHASLYDGEEGLNNNFDLNEPQARVDNYFFITGCMLLLESSEHLQLFFKMPPVLYLGRRSLAWFLTQSIIVYTVGIKLHLHLRLTQGWADESATAVCLIVCLLNVVPVAEVFFRFFEIPSELFAKKAFEWIRT